MVLVHPRVESSQELRISTAATWSITGPEAFRLFSGGMQFFLGDDGCEAFVHENEGKAGQGGGEFPAEGAHLGGRAAFRAVHERGGPAPRCRMPRPERSARMRVTASVCCLWMVSTGMGHDAYRIRGRYAYAWASP